MNRKLKITGTYKGLTGYDNHIRSIIKALYQAGIKLQLIDLPEWSPIKLPLALQDKWFDQLLEPIEANIHLFFSMPHQVQPEIGMRNINYTMFEADRIPKFWVTHSKDHDLIILPANFCKQAWIESGVPEEKLVVCPLGVDSTLFKPEAEPLYFATSDGCSVTNFNVRFLNISDVVERKNLLGLLRAWLIATKVNDDAILILKPGYYMQGSKERFQERLTELEVSVGKSFNQAAPILYIDKILPQTDMPKFYTLASHYISASRGEGFDLPMLEAGVSGLQLVAPRHSAYLDYLTDDIAHLISAKPVATNMPDDPRTFELFAGSYWWEPDQIELCEKIRSIIDGKIERKLSARKELSKLSWSRTAQSLEKIIFSN